MLWPLFARAPRHWFLENFLLSAPGVQSVFFLLRSVGRRDLSAGPEQKKNTTQGVFFLLRPRGKAREGEAPLEAGTGPEQKKTPPRVLFFLLRPRRKAREGEAPLEAGTGPEQKKNTTQGVFFFAPAPGKGRGRRSPVGSRHGARAKSLFFFLLWPRAGAQRGFFFPCLSPGPEQKKNTLGGVFFFALAPCRLPTGLLLPLPFAGAAAKKKHPGWCFFFALAPCRLPTGLLLPLPFAGAAAKKKTPWVVFFFLLRPRADAHSLTAGLGGDASPSPGRCFFLLRPRPDRGGVFFLLWPRPDAHSLTVGWGDFGKARVVFFFLLRPRRVFLDNSKKCLGYYIGSKKTRRGHSKKKNTTSLKNLQGTPESGPKTLNP